MSDFLAITETEVGKAVLAKFAEVINETPVQVIRRMTTYPQLRDYYLSVVAKVVRS
jgi:hypothetical protein